MARIVGALGAFATAAVAALTVAASSDDGVARAAQPRPNVVLIMTDDQTVRDMSVLPDVRRTIGGRGVTFRNSFASYPLCCPSRATMLTGRYSHNHGVAEQPAAQRRLRQARQGQHPPGVAAAPGVRHRHIGKFLNGYAGGVPARVDRVVRVGRPIDLPDVGLHAERERHAEDLREPRRGGPGALPDRRLPPEGRGLHPAPLGPRQALLPVRRVPGPARRGARGPPGERPLGAPGAAAPGTVREQAAAAAAVLQRAGRVRQAGLHPRPGAAPRAPPASPRSPRTSRRARRRCSRSTRRCSEIVATLRATGELDNTYVVFTSDNGFFHGEHRVPNGKLLVYEPSSRVPLLIRGPGIRGGRTTREMAVNPDLAATVLDVTGAKPTRVGRRPLADPLRREALAADPAPGAARDLPPGCGWGPRTGRHSAGAAAAARRARVPSYRAVRTSRWLWVEYSDGSRELYDLARDPQQLRSRHADRRYRRTRAALRRELARLAKCKGKSCRRQAARIPGPTRR